MNEFMIALEEFQDIHVLATGEYITEEEIEDKYDCRVDADTLKTLAQNLRMIHSMRMGYTVGEFNPTI